MKRYCYIQNGVVITIEDEYLDLFPNVHIKDRYSRGFIDSCIIVGEDVEVRPGMLYENGVFKEAPIVEVVPVIAVGEGEIIEVTEFEKLKALVADLTEIVLMGGM